MSLDFIIWPWALLITRVTWWLYRVYQGSLKGTNLTLFSVVLLTMAKRYAGMKDSTPRHYLLDLMRVTPPDANYIGPGSRSCVLRTELIAAFCQAERAKSGSEPDGEAQGSVDSLKASGVAEADKKEANTSTAFPDSQEIANNERNVKKASS